MDFWGMHLFWWVLRLALLIWISALPWEIPGDRRRPRESAVEILKRRCAEGEISAQEFEEQKRISEGAAVASGDDHA